MHVLSLELVLAIRTFCSTRSARVSGMSCAEPCMYMLLVTDGVGSASQCIALLCRYMHRLIQQRMHGIGDASSVTPCFSFPINEMIWLGFLAFRKVLRRKQSSHKELILLLEAELSMKRYTEMESLLYLSSAVDDRRSSMFWSIQY